MQFGDFKGTENVNSTYKRIKELGLEENIVDLDTYGFTVISPEKVAAPEGFLERITDTILRIAKERTGVDLKLDENGSVGTYRGSTPGRWTIPFVLSADGGPYLRRMAHESDALHDWQPSDARPAATLEPGIVRQMER